MATTVKVYKDGNYIIIDDGVKIKEIPTKDCSYDVNGSDYTIADNLKGYETTALPFAAIQDEEGVAYKGEPAFVEFLRHSTGTAPLTDYSKEVSMGKIPNSSIWNKWGYNNDVDTGGEEIVASWGGAFTPPTTAETLDIVSLSPNDTLAGTGIQSIVITGVDANREYQQETVNMNGTTTVTTTSTWLGINRVSPSVCGTGKTNIGDIDVSNSISGDMLAQMPAGQTSTQQCIFYVQDNHTFLASWLFINALKLSGGGGDPEVTIRGYVFNPTINSIILIFKAKLDTARENTIIIAPPDAIKVTENSVLYFTAETDKNNTSVDLRFSGEERKNT